MFPLEKEETKTLHLVVDNLKRETIVTFVYQYGARLDSRHINGAFVLILSKITYTEMMHIIHEYALGLESGKFHLIANPPVPQCDVRLSSV